MKYLPYLLVERKKGSNSNRKDFGAMTYTFFNSKIDSGVNEGLSWFGINLVVSFQDFTQNMFCNLAKISHPVDLEIC